MDYRVSVKLRNNRILRAIEERGYDSIAAFCRDFDLSYQSLIDLVGIRKPALTSRGLYNGFVVRLADALSVNPEDLFTDTQAQANITPSVTRTLSEADALSLASPEARDLIADDSEYGLEAMVDVPRLLTTLSDRERYIVERRWGLGDDPPSHLADLADELNISKPRVQQIEYRALEKLRKKIVDQQHKAA